jgi:single-stranded-DNA-specific exonuclease
VTPAAASTSKPPESQDHTAVLIRGTRGTWRQRTPTTGSGPLLDRVLTARGLNPSDASVFLEPSLKHLHDPSGIPDLDKAAQRLLDALRADEPIVIYGDYDVDGISATAILFHTFRAISATANISTYVPHRVDEGYGLNEAALRDLAAKGARVIVSVDCGITAVGPAKAAKEAGVDLIITDHHNPPARMDDLPDAFAVVHPRRPDSTYPFGDLCGAGVAYKLAWRLATLTCGNSKVTPVLRDLLLELLSLTSLGVIADVVPLLGENRVIARFGLPRIKHSNLIGLQALVEASGLAGENVQAEDVGFKLGPRLNACGRMGHAREAVELFTVANADRAKEISRDLTRQNNARRDVEQKITAKAIELAEQMGMTGPERRAIVLAHEDWHAGVVGIVCSRLVSKFHRPTLLMHRGPDGCHGSGRSVEGFGLTDALGECAEFLSGFGGHDMAAGLRLDAARLDAFTEAFIAAANRRLAADDLVARINYDTAATLDEFSHDVIGTLDQLAPFGRDNPRVHLLVRGVTLADRPKVLGNTGRHAALMLRQNRRTIRCLAWDRAEELATIPTGAVLDVIVTPRISTWNGNRSIEPELVDLRIH